MHVLRAMYAHRKQVTHPNSSYKLNLFPISSRQSGARLEGRIASDFFFPLSERQCNMICSINLPFIMKGRRKIQFWQQRADKRKSSPRSTVFWACFLLSVAILYQSRRLSRIYANWNEHELVPLEESPQLLREHPLQEKHLEQYLDQQKLQVTPSGQKKPVDDANFGEKYAYAFVMAGVDPDWPRGHRAILLSILVNAQILESWGSTADIVVLVQMAPTSKWDSLSQDDLKRFEAYPKIVIHYIPKPIEAPSFYLSQFDKFHVLELTQYSRILYLDADVMPLCNLDYLFHLSSTGYLKENMLLAGNNEPSNGGFMMVRPGVGEYERILRIIEARDTHILRNSPNLTFDEVVGWGHVIQPPDYWRTRYNRKRGTFWNFTTAYGNQGLAYYWAKYVKKSASLFVGNEVENWGPSLNSSATSPVLEETIVDPLKGHECPSRRMYPMDKSVQPPYDMEGQIWHFDGKYGKPWMVPNMSNVLKSNQTNHYPYQTWVQVFDQVQKRLNTSLDVQGALQADPTLGSWTTEGAFKRSLQRKYAYAYLLAGVDAAKPKGYRAILFAILVNAQALESAGSTADVVVLVQMSHASTSHVLPEQDLKYLKAYPSIVIHYLPKPSRAPEYYALQFEKFRILELTQYRRVLYLDADVTPLCNFDYLFHLSEKGVFKDNMVIAGINEPSNGGFMMLRPAVGEYQQLTSIIEDRDALVLTTSPNLTFDEVLGWGHVIQSPDYWRTRYNTKRGTLWNFTTAYGNQGLIYHWIKYAKKSATLFIGNEVENWSGRANETNPVLEEKLVDAIKGHECPNRMEFWHDKLAKTPYDMEGQMMHFWGKFGKPWMLKDLRKVLESNATSSRSYQVWFQHLEKVKRRLNISLDVKNELQHDPALGSWTTEGAFKRSLEKKHAYAFVLAVVDPKSQSGYRAFLFSILVNAHILESWGSMADIVVLVQMAHESESEVLPEEDLSYLKAYPRIVVHYIPKPTERPSFYSSQFDKFYILELTKYRRVLYLDADVMPLCNLDYLFHLSERGILKENMILAGNNEPSNGGFMMLRPGPGEHQKLRDIIEERDARIMATPNKTFDEVVGWGHVIQPPDYWRTRYNRKRGTFWNFTTAYGNQGLMFYWVKYVKKSASLFIGNEVENWGPPVNSNDSNPVLEATLIDVLKGHECPSTLSFPRDKYRKAPYDMEGQMRHFDGKLGKPWMLENVTEILRSNNTSYLGHQLWFQALDQVKLRLNIRYDIINDLRGDPALGSWTTLDDLQSSIAKKALNRASPVLA
jgi:lipopolysaccharide biosynthesis glycosyltransferase